MNKKLLFTSFASIALLGSIVAGGTYALFTSETSTNIAVTSGTVSVEATLENPVCYSMDVQQEGLIFQNGGSAVLGVDGTLALNLITPGDKVTVDLKIKNNSNVNILYRVGYECVTPEGETQANSEKLFSGLTMSFNGVEKSDLLLFKSNYISLPANGTIANIPVIVELPVSAGNEYQALSTTIKFIAEAVQGNATVSNMEEVRHYVPASATPVSNSVELLNAINNSSPASSVVLTDDLVVSTEVGSSTKYINATTDLTIYGNGHKLAVNDNRVVNLTGSEDSTLTIVDAKLTQADDTATYTRGVSLYQNSNATINISNCEVSASYYAFNIASANENVTFNIENTIFTGWCAFQTWSKVSGSFRNCEFYGINDKGYNSEGWNDFATIVFNEDSSLYGTEVTFDNCNFYTASIANSEGNANNQHLLSLRTSGITLRLNDCSFYECLRAPSIEEIVYTDDTNLDVELYPDITDVKIYIDGNLELDL